MTIEQLRAAYQAQPFKPFVLHLADGPEIPVSHREFMMVAPSGQTIVVAHADDTVNIIDVPRITHVEFKPHRNGSAKRRKR